MRISDWSSDVCSSDLAKGEIFLEIIKTADDVEQPAEPFALGRDELQLVALAVRSIGADPRDDRARGEQNIAVELAAAPFAVAVDQAQRRSAGQLVRQAAVDAPILVVEVGGDEGVGGAIAEHRIGKQARGSQRGERRG